MLDYKYYFTVAKKIDFLRAESETLQRLEINRSINNMMQDPLTFLNGGFYLELNLRRDNILEDTLKQLHSKGKGNNLSKPLKIRFL